MAKALDGLRVADFSHVMAGPFASHFLSLLGAEVVKVEAPGRGDAMRDYGADRRYDGMAPGFIAANAAKKSIVLDLKSPDGIATAKALVATSDIVLENFRPGVMARFGLGYDDCRALRDDIVYCSVSGYGQSGPRRDYPAIDNIVQATSGMMSLGGEPDDPWQRVGFPAVDTYTGTLAAMAILSAIVRRERFGAGQFIDVAMLDASMVFMASAAIPYLVSGTPMPRTGNVGYSGQPTAALFRTRDGTDVSLGVVQPSQYARLCAVLGRADLLDDPRIATLDDRRRNGAALRAEIECEFARRDGAEWERVMSAAGVPCGLVRDVPMACDLPDLAARGTIVPMHIPGLPDGENVRVLGAGFVCDVDGPEVTGRPPRLGEHTDEILAALRETA